MDWKRSEVIIKLYSIALKGTDHLGDLGAVGRILLR